MSQELKIHRCCFTGHRPEKLTADSATIKEALATEVDMAIADGITEFITGMVRGVDLWATEKPINLTFLCYSI